MSARRVGERREIKPAAGDALLVVDVQVDFLPGGALPVAGGDQLVPHLNRYMAMFVSHGLLVIATRDMHPPDHCSFREFGGEWPRHCVLGTRGCEFAPGLQLPRESWTVSKATHPQQEAYSGFDGTGLAERLREAGVRRVWVGGLATDYCVQATVLDARRHGFDVILLTDAVRAVDLARGDEDRAIQRMLDAGAVAARWAGSRVCIAMPGGNP
jgi:nicotinamidase/pyrazinamidase